MRPQEETRPALATRKPGDSWKHQTLYTDFDAMQVAALASLDTIHDIETRCLSALWHGLPDSYDLCIAAELVDADLFTFAWHRELFRALLACALHGFRPIIADLLAVMQAGFPDSQIRHSDQLDRIWLTASSSACLSNWARLVVIAARRRKQVSRLWHALHSRIADPIGDAPRRAATVPIIVRPMKRRSA